MRRLWPRFRVVALLLACGCSVDPDVTVTSLELAAVPSCTPDEPVDLVEVRALGDFATTDDTVELLPPASMASRIERFPFETHVLAFETRDPSFRAGALHPYGPEGPPQGSLLMLPFGGSCPLGDAEVHALPGSFAVGLPDGALFAGGGLDGSRGVRAAFVLRPGELLSERVDIELRRDGASATVVGDRLVIAGGAPDGGAGAHDTFETYSLGPEGPTREGGLGILASGGRRDHGAVALADGTILLVGGVVEAGGAPLDTAEVIEPGADESRVIDGLLPFSRTSPEVVRLDEGTVLVLGGIGAGGSATSQVFWYDPDTEQFLEENDAIFVRPRVGAQAVPLPGARVAWVGGLDRDGAPATTIQVIQRQPPFLGGRPALRSLEAPLPASVPPLTRTRAAPLADGTIVLTGRDEEERARAFVLSLQPGSVRAEEKEASRASTHLVRLADGSLAELDDNGGSLRREIVRSAFDNPPATLFAGATDGLAFDFPDHWRRDGGEYVALVEDARVDVPALRFRRFSLSLEASGSVDLLLLVDDAEPVRVHLSNDEVGPALCTVPRVDGAPLALARDGRALVLSAGGEEKTCQVDLPERVGLALVAQPGAAILALRIARPPPG